MIGQGITPKLPYDELLKRIKELDLQPAQVLPPMIASKSSDANRLFFGKLEGEVLKEESYNNQDKSTINKAVKEVLTRHSASGSTIEWLFEHSCERLRMGERREDFDIDFEEFISGHYSLLLLCDHYSGLHGRTIELSEGQAFSDAVSNRGAGRATAYSSKVYNP
ncbi:hypothetical protein TrVE_jg509 [Triparma verrucosa]|uniref:Uncharacterized protein n=1 Tax=Triparma verrucosa TaxID=1606542 RepID=A0A9W7BTK4_9STRA|nr:hypothetical protein TrVE_jg509 [Triparma verrucosa]